MKLTVSCYLEQKDCWLMLHRTKKKEDLNKGKWIGVGGKLEPGESPDECVLREVREETGLTLTEYRLRGLITFNFLGPDVPSGWETEYMFLYTATAWEGELTECSEGDLAWIPLCDVPTLNLWPGDRIFMERLRANSPFFSYKMIYAGDTLQEWHAEEAPLIQYAD